MFASLALLLISVRSTQDSPGMFPKWVWAQPLPVATKEDRLGRSERQILAMGRDKWNELRQMGADFADIVYARCLYDRNCRVLSRLPTPRRRLVEDLRTDVWLMANACIGLLDTENGGGTAAIHFPRYARIDVEQLAYELATRAGPTRLRFPAATVLSNLRSSLERRAKSPKWPLPTVDGTTPNMKDEHRFANLALKYLDASLKLCRALPSSKRKAVLRVLDLWSIGDHEPGMFKPPG